MGLAKDLLDLAGWRNHFLFLLLFTSSTYPSPIFGESMFDFEKKQYASTAVESVAGQSAQMPCNMTVAQNDTVYLVLWFKEGLTTPIYSYDVRELLSGEPKHWWDADLLGSRAFFNAHSSPAHLLLRHVAPEDAGLYKCRVDFQREPTRNSRVNLTIVVPPRDVVIKDSNDQEVRSIIGPKSEGDSLRLSCVAYGGIPPPKLVWLLNGKIFDDVIDSAPSSDLINVLSIEKLTRDHLRAQLTCKASYGKAYTEFLTTATLDMNLEPLDVRIHPTKGPLSAGRAYELICSSRGSRPPAVLTWWKGSERIPAFSDQTSPDGNVSRSVIKMNINASHNGLEFTCRAKNLNIPAAVIEDSLKITVYYLPLVKVNLGASLDPSNMKEGDDVYFECTVEANPPVYKVLWKHNSKMVHQNKHSGILLSNRSLVLQDIKRSHSGSYTCVASNVEGDGESRPLNLRIQYAPVCKTVQSSVYGVSKLENAHVTCQVDAVPQATKFRWWFNNTAETLEVPEGRFTVGLGGRSVVTYTPTSDLDYGTLLCGAENSVGEQDTPCVFHIVPASPPARPESPTNCTIHNVSANSLAIKCSEGFDGGLNQSFVMEVYTTNPHTLHTNITSSKPCFEVSGLESDSEIQLILYSGNSKGRSGITRLLTYTLKPPVKQLETRLGTGGKPLLDSNQLFSLPTILGCFLGGSLVLVLLIIATIVSSKRKCWRRDFDNDSGHHSSDDSQTHFTSDLNYQQCESFNHSFLSSHHQSSQPKVMKCQHQSYNLQHQISGCQEIQSQKYPITTDFRDIPPPPSQYSSDSSGRESSTQLRVHQHLTSNQKDQPEIMTLPMAGRGHIHIMHDRTTGIPECHTTYQYPSWVSEPSTQPPCVVPDDNRVPLVYVSDTSSRRQSCASVNALATISEGRESPGGPSSDRSESAL